MEIIEQVYANKCINGENLEKLAASFGERLWKALRTITERRVTKHTFKPSNKQIWTVSGKNRDYLIISDFYCTCDDFYLNVVIRKKIKVCYHILAKRLAEALDLYTSYSQTDDDYEKLMLKLKTLEIKNLRKTKNEKNNNGACL
ncbi:MAG: hypothetical protein QXO71_09860 [Candidatus Jordarchaeaceae archaeon]